MSQKKEKEETKQIDAVIRSFRTRKRRRCLCVYCSGVSILEGTRVWIIRVVFKARNRPSIAVDGPDPPTTPPIARSNFVAIKIIGKRAGCEIVEGREVSIQRAINDDHIVQLVDAFQTPHAVVLVLEFCDRSFQDFVESKGGRLPDEKEVRDVAKQLVSGISVLHANHVAHRDIKPANVLMNMERGGYVLKLADFGCSKQAALYQTHCGIGTPIYRSPELARPTGGYGPGVDIWALGILLFEFITGTLPFEEPSNEEELRKLLEGGGCFELPEFAPRTQRRFSPQLRNFISAMLMKDPAQRITADQLEVHPFLCDAPAPEAPLPPPPAGPASQPDSQPSVHPLLVSVRHKRKRLFREAEWFSYITGDVEASFRAASAFKVVGKTRPPGSRGDVHVLSVVNPKTRTEFAAGAFYTPTIRELLDAASSRSGEGVGEKCVLDVLSPDDDYSSRFVDAAVLQASSKNAGAMFQVPTPGFTCVHAFRGSLDAPDFIETLASSWDQGSRASLGTGAAAIARFHAAFFDPRKQASEWRQSSKKQVQLLDSVSKYINVVGGQIAANTPRQVALPQDQEQLVLDIRVGVQLGAQVVFGDRDPRKGPEVIADTRQRVHQVIVGTVGSGSGRVFVDREKARLLLRAAYRGSYLAAMANGCERLFLTVIGGGFGGFDFATIGSEIRAAHNELARSSMNRTLRIVRLVIHTGDPGCAEFVSSLEQSHIPFRWIVYRRGKQCVERDTTKLPQITSVPPTLIPLPLPKPASPTQDRRIPARPAPPTAAIAPSLPPQPGAGSPKAAQKREESPTRALPQPPSGSPTAARKREESPTRGTRAVNQEVIDGFLEGFGLEQTPENRAKVIAFVLQAKKQ